MHATAVTEADIARIPCDFDTTPAAPAHPWAKLGKAPFACVGCDIRSDRCAYCTQPLKYRCAVCNRELSDPVSVEAGIGPICAERFGW
jgi:Family of unknown function (DUF6011)